MGDNSAGISTIGVKVSTGLILIFFICNSTSDVDSNPRPDTPLCILVIVIMLVILGFLNIQPWAQLQGPGVVAFPTDYR